jgi:hypothetical protein
MFRQIHVLAGLIGLTLFTLATAHKSVAFDAVTKLTFRAERQTTHRRLSALPQVNCGEPCPEALHAVHCARLKEGDNRDWACVADSGDASNEFTVDDVEISCEGYNRPDDVQILSGSCALQCRVEEATSSWLPIIISLCVIAFICWHR